MKQLLILLFLVLTACGKYKPVDRNSTMPINDTPYITKGIQGPFQVHKGMIMDSGNNRIVVKGTSMFDYMFCLGSSMQYDIPTQLARGNSVGVNLVRTCVDTSMTSFDQLDQVIAQAVAYNMIIEIQFITYPPITEQDYAFLRTIGARYAGVPNLWINPSNEINCSTGDLSVCEDPYRWKADITHLISVLRDSGFTNPIVIQGITWGAYLDGSSWGDNKTILDYMPDDGNLIVGVHKYANYDLSVNTQTEINTWGYLTGKLAITIDETGFYNNGPNGTLVGSAEWSMELMQFASSWVNMNGGSGLTAISWYDGICTPSYHESCLTESTGVFTLWGYIFKDYFLSAVK